VDHSSSRRDPKVSLFQGQADESVDRESDDAATDNDEEEKQSVAKSNVNSVYQSTRVRSLSKASKNGRAMDHLGQSSSANNLIIGQKSGT